MQNKTEPNTETETPHDELEQAFALFRKLFEAIREMSPVEKDKGDKYLQFTISGHASVGCNIRVFYDSDCSFDAKSIAEVRQKLSEYNPEVARLKRIAALQAELAKLEPKPESAEVPA